MKIGLLTSGGDAPGMNAAIRSIVRCSLSTGEEVVGIYNGYRGLIEGGDNLRPLGWHDVAGIVHRGGTILGSARCAEFRQRSGRRLAARNLLAHGLSRLCVIGGDGSLAGAQILHEEWPELLAELVKEGELAEAAAQEHSQLSVVGLPGSIDNDLPGIDVSIGADTALQRIVEAVDRIFSTADSHERTFVVEVMGRRCGYLALMAALAGGAEAAILPECPLGPDWRERLCETLRQARSAGRRASIVMLAEGARDQTDQPITSQQVQDALRQGLNEEVRISILGHVQRGGAPSAFDRNQSILLGASAVEQLKTQGPPVLIGMCGNRPRAFPLRNCLELSSNLDKALRENDESTAVQLRGPGFAHALKTRLTLAQARPGLQRERQGAIAIMHAGSPASGMNAAVRACVRLLGDSGHHLLGVRRGPRGLVDGDFAPLDWMGVSGWCSRGGAELGTSRMELSGPEFYSVARQLERFQVKALVVIGGLAAYELARQLLDQRGHYPSFSIPIVCIPASIDNDLPGSDFSIGADTALNSIVEVIDKIKESALASQRCSIVEVMGKNCGYLALMSALACGAEKAYLPEHKLDIHRLLQDLEEFRQDFQGGRRMALAIRNENCSQLYTTPFIASLFSQESGDLFDVRQAILGHLQQGGAPTPFDRTLAIRLVRHACQHLHELIAEAQAACLGVGLVRGRMELLDLTQPAVQEAPAWLDYYSLLCQLSHAPAEFRQFKQVF